MPHMLALKVGSGKTPDKPVMNLVLPELVPAVGSLRFAMLCKWEADAKPDPDGPLGPRVVFDPAARLPVPVGRGGKMPLPVGNAVGPPVVSDRA